MPRALPLYIDAAEKGARHSASETGRFFEFGWVGEKDPAKAEHFYRLSAARGSYWGAYNLGRLGLKNAKTKAQTEEAVRWLEFAARQENMSATMRLANLYKVDSDWVEADLDKRTYWLNWAALHDHAEAHLALGKDILGKPYWLKDLNIFAEMWDSFSRALALENFDSLEEMVYVLTRSYGPRFEPHTALKLLETYFDKYPKSKLLSARITMSNFEGITNPKASKELISEYDSEIGGKPSIENFYLIILFPKLFENPIDAIKAYTIKRYGDDITSSRYNSLWKQIFLSESIEEVCDLLASDIASRLPTKENKNPRYTIQGRKLIRTINPGLGGALRGINFNMSVEVTFQILPSGQVSNITVTQSNHPFASSVISRIVERWKWEPAPDKGAKIMPARITLTYKR
jgi:TonB family protein